MKIGFQIVYFWEVLLFCCIFLFPESWKLPIYEVLQSKDAIFMIYDVFTMDVPY